MVLVLSPPRKGDATLRMVICVMSVTTKESSLEVAHYLFQTVISKNYQKVDEKKVIEVSHVN